jgi:hypothetical protein
MNTPDNIQSLKSNEIFVFGSNTEGRHGAGAARLAMEFSAIYGQARGLQGQAYAIVTKDLRKGNRSVSPLEIRAQVRNMYSFAKQHPQLVFLVTKIGTGLGGFTVEEMRVIFKGLAKPVNVLLPKEFEA